MNANYNRYFNIVLLFTTAISFGCLNGVIFAFSDHSFFSSNFSPSPGLSEWSAVTQSHDAQVQFEICGTRFFPLIFSNNNNNILKISSRVMDTAVKQNFSNLFFLF